MRYRRPAMDTPFPVLLALFGVVAVIIVVFGAINGRRAMLDRLVALEGEKTLLELDVRFSALLHQRAVVNSLVYLKARLRVTDRRVIVAQQGLFSSKCVVRYAGYRTGEPPSDRENGYPCFALQPPHEVNEGGVRELRLVPRSAAPLFPSYVAIRSDRLDEILRTLAA